MVARLAKRAFREREHSFVAEGPQAVREALASPGVVREVYVTRPAAERHADMLDAADCPIRLVSGEVATALSATVTPQGILAVCRFVHVELDSVLAAEPSLVAILAQVRDPGNAGTILRCADAAGADAVLFSDASVDVYNSKCVRASAGSLFHLPVVVGVPLPIAVARLRRSGLRVLAADGYGSVELPQVVTSGELAEPTSWLFGNEAWGLPADTRKLADQVVRVPVYGRAESLNLATAAAVCLYASATAQHA